MDQTVGATVTAQQTEITAQQRQIAALQTAVAAPAAVVSPVPEGAATNLPSENRPTLVPTPVVAARTPANLIAAVIGNSGTGNSGRSIVLLRPDGSMIRQLTHDVHFNEGPKVAPDGRSIAFYSDANGSSLYAYDVYRISVDGSGLVRLTMDGSRGNAHSYNPTWSADGTRIAFDAWPDGVSVIDRDGGNRHLVTKDGANPDWSPTADELAVKSYSCGGIAVVRIDGSGLTCLAQGKGMDNGPFPRWSPDGSQIVFDIDGKQIGIVKPDGSDLKIIVPRLPAAAEAAEQPVWSPDGTQVMFGCLDQGFARRECIMKADGSGQRVFSQAGWFSPDWR